MKILHLKITAFLVTSLFAIEMSSSALATDVMSPKINEKFQLKINQTAYIQSENLEITLQKIQDSRCPLGVTCVWEGEAKVEINVLHEKQNLGNFNLTSRNNLGMAQFMNYDLDLIGVEPYPQSEKQTQLSDYSVTLIVTKQKVISPLKQFQSGIISVNVKCKEGFQLITKNKDGSPACVAPQTAKALILRGWAHSLVT